MTERVWLRAPEGDTQEVEAVPKILVPLMVQGWRQCDPPEEVREDVRKHS